MKNLFFLPAFHLSFSLVSCNDNDNNHAAQASSQKLKNINTGPVSNVVKHTKLDTAGMQPSCTNNIKSLFVWAKVNIDTLSITPFIGYNPDSSHRIVLFKNTDRYLGFLEKSGFFSQHFINVQKKIYSRVNISFVHEAKNSDETPLEMRYNFVFISNESDEDLATSNKYIFTAKQGNVNVDQSTRLLIYKMNNLCQIDSVYTSIKK